MSINEIPAAGSNLTEKQQREAMAAVYDLAGASMHPNTQNELMDEERELTYVERVRMRQHLDNLDQKQAGGLKEFDLNKPPVPPYAYREYPFLMYNHRTKQTRAALNHEQRQKMLAGQWPQYPGQWSEEPARAEIPEVELTVSERLQAEEIDRRLKMPKEQLETELSAQHMAEMRTKIAELEARLAHEDLNKEPEMATTEISNRKRSKA